MLKKEQFKGFSISGYTDKYTIAVPENTIDIPSKIIEFYTNRKAEQEHKNSLTFMRGSKFWTWFNFWSELWPLHKINAEIQDNNKVKLIYETIGGFWIRLPPSQFEKEVIELSDYISKT